MTSELAESAITFSPHPKYPSDVWVFEEVEEFIQFLKDYHHPTLDAINKWGDERTRYWNSELPSNARYPSTLLGSKSKFNCSTSVTRAFHMLQHGWRDGMQRMLDFEGQVAQAFNRHVELPHFAIGEEGSEVEMGRFLSGEPDHMIGYRTTETDKQSPLITLDLNLACSTCETRCCDHTPVDPDWQMMRGAVLFLLVKIMRQAGLFPEVWLGTVAFYDRKSFAAEQYGGFRKRGFPTHTTTVYGWSDFAHGLIKEKKRTTLVRALGPSDFFDPSRLAFLFAHDSFVRRLQFRMEEVLNFKEAGGAFPMATTEIPATSGTQLGGYAPTTVGALPLRDRDKPHNLPEFQVLMEDNPGRAHIHIPSYPQLAKTDPDALGTYGKPETAARHLLGLLTAAGVRLT